ncbi:MAG: hypothetical protein LBU40_02035, partial [Methanobrevibacter sp.]|nr:hypothetical protein [Methanobrevibacter sp.]
VTNKSALTVYQISNPTNETKYVAVYNPEGVYIVVGAPDLESLKLMISSIVFKKIVEKEDNNTQHTNTETENTNEIPNESDYGDSEWFYDEAVELYYYYDENGNRIYV